MKAVTCPSCGAPVPPEGADATLTCPFCGSTLAGTGLLPRAGGRPVAIDLTGVRRASTAVFKFVLFFFLGISLLIGWIVWTTVGSATRQVRQAFSSVGDSVAAVSARGRAWKVAELGRLSGGSGWIALDAAPPAGGYGALDAVAALPWAVAIAQAWAPDAMLHRIDVARLRPDGTVNVADDEEAEVTYRFQSPARIRDYRKRAELSKKAEAEAEFFVRVERGRPTALVVTGDLFSDDTPPYPSKALPLTAIARRLARDERYARPFLEGYLIFLDDEGWVWYLSPLARGSESLPRVRAADGQPWPWRR